MHNITLICTNHLEFGKCNSEELYKIIEFISPDVIFEEIPLKLFEIIYNDKLIDLTSEVVTEIKCVKKYLQNYHIKHIPVDTDIRFISDNEHNWMFDIFEKYADYNKINNDLRLLTEQFGFSFINSNECLDLSEQLNIVKEDIMNVDINKNELNRVHQLFNKQDDTRENAMLQNIYDFSKKIQYNQAVFLIGSAHKKALMQKINRYEKLPEIKLKWKMNGTNNKTYR